MYKKQANMSLQFKEADLTEYPTIDLVISFCKEKCADWKEKSAGLMNMTNEEFEVLYLSREKFYNK
jgi:hypothetical protein